MKGKKTKNLRQSATGEIQLFLRPMPLLLKKKYPREVEWSIWLKLESNKTLVDLIPSGFISDLKPDEWTGISGKLGERLAARAALVHLFEIPGIENWQVVKEPTGQPKLIPSGKFHISISHSYELAAAMKAPMACGIDIQAIQDKIFRIQSKFANEIETGPQPSKEHLHVLWGAKEAMYKAFGKRGLDFKVNMNLNPFEYQPNGGTTHGVLSKGEVTLFFEIHYLTVNNQMLVWALQTK